MKKFSISVVGAIFINFSAIAIFAGQDKDPLRVGDLTLKPGSYADSVCDTLTGERNLYLDFAAKNEDNTVNAVIEIPAGTNDKWETDVNTGRLFWELKNGAPRVIKYLGYPANYGMIPRTLGGDGDPLDIIVMGGMMRRGGVGGVKPIGVFRLVDNGEVDDKVLAVLPGSFMEGINSLDEFNSQYPGALSTIETWFTNYKGINGGLSSNGFQNVDTAWAVIDAAVRTSDAPVFPASYNEHPDDSLTIDGFTRTYGQYGASLSGVLGNCDTLSGGNNMYLDYTAKNDDQTVNAVIEIPCGTNAKWETDVKTGKLFWENRLGLRRVVRFLGYPGNYGMVPRTKGGDGDPLDVIVLGASKLRGEVVPVKVIGVLFLIDAGLLDDKLIAVMPGQPMSEVNTMAGLNANYPGAISIIQAWFTNYKGIGGGLSSRGFGERDTAGVILDRAISDFGSPVRDPAASGRERWGLQLERTERANSAMRFTFSLERPEKVTIRLYSLLGNEIAQFVNGHFTIGRHHCSWDSRSLRAGCYLLKIQAGAQSQVKSIHIVK